MANVWAIVIDGRRILLSSQPEDREGRDGMGWQLSLWLEQVEPNTSLRAILFSSQAEIGRHEEVVHPSVIAGLSSIHQFGNRTTTATMGLSQFMMGDFNEIKGTDGF